MIFMLCGLSVMVIVGVWFIRFLSWMINIVFWCLVCVWLIWVVCLVVGVRLLWVVLMFWVRNWVRRLVGFWVLICKRLILLLGLRFISWIFWLMGLMIR